MGDLEKEGRHEQKHGFSSEGGIRFDFPPHGPKALGNERLIWKAIPGGMQPKGILVSCFVVQGFIL